MNDAVAVRPLDLGNEKDWVRSVLGDAFGSWRLIVQGETLDASALQGFVAGKNDGLAQYRETDDKWLELVTLVSLDEGRGIGRSLIEEIKRHGQAGAHIGITVTTTNDNLRALALYQRNGFHLHDLRPGALDYARDIEKLPIPAHARNGIRIGDEIELRFAF